MKNGEVIEIDQKTALEAVKQVKSNTIHCFIGFIGADWDKKGIIDLIKKSKRIAWAYNMFNHNLAVIDDERLYSFDIPK